MLITAPQLTIFVVGADNNVAILCQTNGCLIGDISGSLISCGPVDGLADAKVLIGLAT